MFNGNIKGNMELNELKLREIGQDIGTRRLAQKLSAKASWLEILRGNAKLFISKLNSQSESILVEAQLTETRHLT